MIELLTPAQMREADRLTIATGKSGFDLMKEAGAAVEALASQYFENARSVLVIAGPGNNGGDGFIAAQSMADTWRTVHVALMGDADKLSGDARLAFEAWTGETLPWSPDLLAEADVIIDAVFGAGLSRDVTGPFADMITAVNATGKPVLSVDIPSGVDGETGQVRGAAIRATATVTFFRKKPGHLLLPGRMLCGPVSIVDIGIGPDVLAAIGVQLVENEPGLWGAVYQVPRLEGHKYDRGHAVVLSGAKYKTGAARLAASAALRAGAGLVTLVSPLDAADENAAHLTAVMLKTADGAGQLEAILQDMRLNALVLGPGMGSGAATRSMVLAALSSGRPCVLDADALTSFETRADVLGRGIAASSGAVLTPHGGEFARLFGEPGPDKVAATRNAAQACGGIVIFKGADTVVAAPDGRATINVNAPPWMATAGSGDVLAGVIGGHLAMGMPAFEAACAAVWLHGRAGQLAGPGLTSEDLDAGLHAAIRELLSGA